LEVPIESSRLWGYIKGVPTAKWGYLGVALTDAAVRKSKGKAKQYKLADAAGLYLLVKPDGSKYWRLKYRHAGKEKLLALGVYDAVSLASAREKRDQAKAIIRQGLDPSVAKKLERRAAEIASANTFEVVAREWINRQKKRWIPAHSDRVLDSLETDVFPEIGNRPIAAIAAPELLAALRKIEFRGALETAQRVLQRCGSVFRFGIASGLCTYNPAADLRGALATPKRKNYAALSAKDLPEFLAKLNSYDGRPETIIAIRLLMLTIVRTGELRGAEWPEIDIEGAQWIVPAERMKMKAPHLVPLSKQAINALKALNEITGSGQFLFPQVSKPEKCMSENTILFALYRMGYHSRATGHGFRATASTILNEMGWKPDAIERQLAHTEKNKVRAAYHRSEYLDERKKMMQRWADYLDAVAAGGKVLPLRKAG
jgi:integrase